MRGGVRREETGDVLPPLRAGFISKHAPQTSCPPYRDSNFPASAPSRARPAGPRRQERNGVSPRARDEPLIVAAITIKREQSGGASNRACPHPRDGTVFEVESLPPLQCSAATPRTALVIIGRRPPRREQRPPNGNTICFRDLCKFQNTCTLFRS